MTRIPTRTLLTIGVVAAVFAIGATVYVLTRPTADVHAELACEEFRDVEDGFVGEPGELIDTSIIPGGGSAYWTAQAERSEVEAIYEAGVRSDLELMAEACSSVGL